MNFWRNPYEVIDVNVPASGKLKIFWSYYLIARKFEMHIIFDKSMRL